MPNAPGWDWKPIVDMDLTVDLLVESLPAAGLYSVKISILGRQWIERQVIKSEVNSLLSLLNQRPIG